MRVPIGSMAKTWTRRALVLAVVLVGVWGTPPVRAKSATQVRVKTVYGGIAGTVTDRAGAAMPGVRVTITSVERGTADIVVSDASGQYTKRSLTPGLYEVRARLAGFKVALVRRLRVREETQTRLDVRMVQRGATMMDFGAAGPVDQRPDPDRAERATPLAREADEVVELAVVEGVVLADVVPGGATGNGRGIAFDGTNLWYTLESDPRIYNVTTAGAPIGSITVAGNAASGGPLSWDGSALWTADYSNTSVLLRVNPANGAILSSCDFVAANPGNPAVTTPGKGIGFFPDGLDWTGSTNWLSGEGASNAGNWVAELDTNCVILQAFVGPPNGSDGTSGVAFVADSFTGDKLRHAHPDALDIVETNTAGALTGPTFATAHQEEDLAFDPVTFAPKCALWANEATLGANHLTAYEINCPERAITATGTTINATEGASFTGTVATFTDPDPNSTAAEYAATINWGDGTAPTAGTISGPTGGPFTVSGTHTYTEEGTYTITVTITDVDTPSNNATATSTAHVADAALTAGALVVSSGGVEGVVPTNVTFTFTDANPFGTVADFTATITWGDGSSSAGIVAGPAGGPYTVTGSHTYTEEGSYTVTVTVHDDGGSSTSKSGTASVADAPLAATCAAAPVSPMSFSGPVATFTDANPFATVADFSATIDWGDGSTTAGTVSGPPGGPFTVSGSHVYATSGPVTITTTILDDGGSTAMTTCAVLIFGTSEGGNFVIGDGNSAVGTQVTFWGAKWWKLNTLSGGVAPASFKGFENVPSTPPACGTSWTTDPGNSAPPPAGPLPAYMAVIVSSNISKTGSTISGDTPKVVVVKVDPGYAPNPGHAGTGTVVAVVCP
jgi:PKD repeat protein